MSSLGSSTDDVNGDVPTASPESPAWLKETNHRGMTSRDIICNAVDGSLARAYEVADQVLAALDEAGFMVVSQEYVG